MDKKYFPAQIVWETTLKCNLRCIHCGSSAGKPRTDELTTNEALTLCNDLAEIKTQEVCLMGGEPFLRKDWYIIAEKVKDLNMKLLFISNGYIVNKNIISKLKKLDPYAVSTSLDGATAKTHDFIRGRNGSFQKVMHFISLLKEVELPTTVITTVNKINMKELPQIRDLLLNKKIAWQIQVCTPEGRFSKKYALSKEEYYSVALFIASLKSKYTSKQMPVIGAHCFGYHSKHLPSLGLNPNWAGCQAGISILSIKSNGDITGCLATPDEFIEGNIRKRSIIDIWNSPNSFSYNRKFKIKNLGKNCKNCENGKTCKGGCLGMSIGFTGKPHNHPYCFYKIEDELFEENKSVLK